jgi:hypothetical protein
MSEEDRWLKNAPKVFIIKWAAVQQLKIVENVQSLQVKIKYIIFTTFNPLFTPLYGPCYFRELSATRVVQRRT